MCTQRAKLKKIILPELDDSFWDCAMAPKHVLKMLSNVNINNFWKEVVQAWFEFTWGIQNKDVEEVRGSTRADNMEQLTYYQ